MEQQNACGQFERDVAWICFFIFISFVHMHGEGVI